MSETQRGTGRQGQRRGRDDRRGRDQNSDREKKDQYLERVVSINRVAMVVLFCVVL